MMSEDQSQDRAVSSIRRCHDDDRDAVLAIVSAAAEAYRGIIPVSSPNSAPWRRRKPASVRPPDAVACRLLPC
jgi:hypothetical protein